LEHSLWHGYLDEYPVYTSLFFPHIQTDKTLSATFLFSLETHFFLKIQAFKLLAGHQKTLHISRVRVIARSLRKFINEKAYQHLNTPDYQQVTNECELYQFCNKLNISADNHETEEVLTDGSSFARTILSNDDVRWITESKTNIKNFFNSFCSIPGNWQEPKPRGKDKSERSKYNRQMGLVLSMDSKQTHILENIEIDATSSKLKTIRRKISSLNDVSIEVLEEESSDDLEEEIQTDDLLWPQAKPCELNNPIASLISGQRLLPHIALNNQLLRPRAIENDIQSILNLIQKTAELVSQNIKALNPLHIKESLKWLLALLIGRVVDQVETEAFFLNDKNIFINEDVTMLRVGFPQYKHRGYLGHKTLYINTETEDLELIIPKEIKKILTPLVNYLKTLRGENSHITLKSKNKNSSYSDCDKTAIKAHVQRNYSAITSDSWLLSIFTWQTGGLSNTQKHYASYPLKKAQSIFEEHIHFFLKIDCKRAKWSNRNNKRIGSPYYLNTNIYSQIIMQLWLNSAPLRKPLNYQSLKLNELKFQFNSLAFWIDSFCAFSAATRNIIDPLIQFELVSEDGLYRVNDKNKFDGFNTRIAFVPATLLTQLNVYKKIRQKVLIYLKKKHSLTDKEKAILDSNQLFFFQQDRQRNLKIVEYTRSRCRDEIYYQVKNDQEITILHDDLITYEYLRALKTNVNRHYLRGRLLDLGMPGYFIDAFMGHWHAGTQPWGKMSIFNQSEYLKSLQQHTPKILKELGFYSEGE